jgi:hypothetical protein
VQVATRSTRCNVTCCRRRSAAGAAARLARCAAPHLRALELSAQCGVRLVLVQQRLLQLSTAADRRLRAAAARSLRASPNRSAQPRRCACAHCVQPLARVSVARSMAHVASYGTADMAWLSSAKLHWVCSNAQHANALACATCKSAKRPSVASRCKPLQAVASRCKPLQAVASGCKPLQAVASRCKRLCRQPCSGTCSSAKWSADPSCAAMSALPLSTSTWCSAHSL